MGVCYCLQICLVIILLLKLVFTEIISYGPEYSCLDDAGCNRYRDKPCSFCANIDDNTTGRCFMPFKYMFRGYPECKKNIECDKSCYKRGECYAEEHYAPYCSCTHPYHGAACQLEGEESDSVLSYFKWRFHGFITPGQLTTLNFVAGSSPGSIFYNTDLFIIINGLLSPRLVTTTDKKISKDFYERYYTWETTLPFKSVKKHSHYTLQNKVVGYTGDIAVLLKRGESVLYENHWRIFVEYRKANLKCSPVIKVSNCGTKEQPVNFIRSSSIEMSGQTMFLKDGKYVETSIPDSSCKNTATISWQLWRINDNGNEDKFALPLYQNYSVKTVEFEPFSLSFGYYKIQFKANVFQPKEISSSIKTCYFKVMCIPLVANVDGGRDRRIFKKSGLRLSASRSHDPNMPAKDQNDLFIEWTCVNLLHPDKYDPACTLKVVSVHETYFIPPKDLTYSAVYNFTLKIWSDRYKNHQGCSKKVSPKYAYLRIEVADEKEHQADNILIQCLHNCKDKVTPNRLLYLKVKSTSVDLVENNYTWTYTKHHGEELPGTDIMSEGVPSYMFLVNPNVLEIDTTYTVIVRVNGTGLYAKYLFETSVMYYNGTCKINPDSGTEGFTLFEIICALDPNYPYMFEFYNKNLEELEEGFVFNGRMLGTSYTGLLSDVVLTREYVFVYIIDKFGLYTNRTVTLKLSTWEATSEHMKIIYDDLDYQIQNGDIPSTLRYISFIPDIIPASMDNKKSDILNLLLYSVTQVPVKSMADVKLCTSTLTNVLLTLNKDRQFQLSPSLMMYTMEIINSLADILYANVVGGKSLQMTNVEVQQITLYLLNSVDAAMLSKNQSTQNINEDDIPTVDLYQLRKGSVYVEETIDIIKNILSYVQSPGQPASKVVATNSSFVVWVMENDVGYKLSKLLNTAVDVPIQLSKQAETNLEHKLRKNQNLALQVVKIDENIFWWSQYDIKSKLVTVSLAKQSQDIKLIPIKFISSPLSVFIDMEPNLTNAVISSSTVQLDYNMKMYDLDEKIRVHRLDPAPSSMVYINFLFPQTNASLRMETFLKNKHHKTAVNGIK